MKTVKIINIKTGIAEEIKFATVETARAFYNTVRTKTDLLKYKVEYGTQESVVRCSGITMY